MSDVREAIEDGLSSCKKDYEFCDVVDAILERVEMMLGDIALYRIVEDDPEYAEYRVLTENQHQPLPDGVMRWYATGDGIGSPDGYLVTMWSKDSDE